MKYNTNQGAIMNIKQQIKELQDLINQYELSDDGYYLTKLYKEHRRQLAGLKSKIAKKSK